MQPKYRLKNVLTGESYQLTQPSSVIGRNHHCEIKIDSVALSRNHASLHLTDHGVVLEDLNSTNGTYVNNNRIDSPTLLTDGDVVTIGNHRLVLIEPTQGAAVPLSENQIGYLNSDLVDDLDLFKVDGDLTANKTMIHSDFAHSMGVLPVDVRPAREESTEELILRALRSKPFDPARVPAVLIVKNSRKRGLLIQLKAPIGGAKEWAIGRSKLADVVLDDPTVSTLHAVISADDQQWVITDNESTNGIKINQVAARSGVCEHGDTITIGNIELIFYRLHV